MNQLPRESSLTTKSEKLNNKIEMLQHNAAKFACNSYPRKGHYEEFSISNLLTNLQWESLEDRRNKAKLNMAYKIINDKVILSSNMLPRPIRPLRNCNVGSVGTENQLFEPISRLKAVEKTFFYQVPKLWNNIVTREQASAPSFDSFKNHFKRNKSTL